jgi:hypothetical protein
MENYREGIKSRLVVSETRIEGVLYMRIIGTHYLPTCSKMQATRPIIKDTHDVQEKNRAPMDRP